MTYRFYLVYALIAVAAGALYAQHNRDVPQIDDLSTLPTTIASWSMTSNATFSESILQNLIPTDYLSRVYKDDTGAPVSLYIGYHNGADSGAIHSPRLCLPGSGWNPLFENKIVFETTQASIPMVHAVYTKGASKILVYYWFRVVGQDINNHYWLKFSELYNSIVHNRKDAALIRVQIPMGKGEDFAHAKIAEFIALFYPPMIELLPKRPL